jgi:hypothetical protein
VYITIWGDEVETNLPKEHKASSYSVADAVCTPRLLLVWEVPLTLAYLPRSERGPLAAIHMWVQARALMAVRPANQKGG